MRTILLLALAVVAAFLIWFLGIRAEASDAIAPASSAETASREEELVRAGAEVAEPPADATRAVQAVDTEVFAGDRGTPTLVLVHVTAVETGKPVEHMRVNAWGEKTLLVLGSQAQETDEEGFVEMEVEPGFALLVNAQGDGRITGNAQVRVDPLKPGERRSVALAVVTRPDRVVHGIVLRRESREPIAVVSIEPVSIFPTDPIPSAVTGNDGRFEIAVRSFAIAALRFEHREFGTVLSPMRGTHDSPENPLEILLDRAASLRGIVAKTGRESTSSWVLVATAQADEVVQPSGGRELAIPPLEWTAPVAGRLERLPPNARLSVEIRDGTRLAWRAAEPIVLEPGEERVLDCNVGFGTLEGFVRDADGSPARNVEIALVVASFADERRILEAHAYDVRTTSSDDGSFRFEHVPLGSWFVLPVTSRMSLHAYRDSVRLAERFEIQHDGDRVVRDIVLIRGLSIVGRVVDAQGNGVPLASVRGQHESIPGSVEVLAGPDGAFALFPLAPGAWVLGAAVGTKFTAHPGSVPAGASDVVLVLD